MAAGQLQQPRLPGTGVISRGGYPDPDDRFGGDVIQRLLEGCRSSGWGGHTDKARATVPARTDLGVTTMSAEGPPVQYALSPVERCRLSRSAQSNGDEDSH